MSIHCTVLDVTVLQLLTKVHLKNVSIFFPPASDTKFLIYSRSLSILKNHKIFRHFYTKELESNSILPFLVNVPVKKY